MGYSEADLAALKANLAAPRQPVQESTGPITFHVVGEPIPQGSMRGFIVGRIPGKQHVALTSDNPRLSDWRDRVTAAARAHAPWLPWDCPVAVAILFRMPRPKSAPKSRIYPTVKPDGDKMERAIFDAVTKAGIWCDDGQAVSCEWRKVYGDPGCTVTLTQVRE